MNKIILPHSSGYWRSCCCIQVPQTAHGMIEILMICGVQDIENRQDNIFGSSDPNNH